MNAQKQEGKKIRKKTNVVKGIPYKGKNNVINAVDKKKVTIKDELRKDTKKHEEKVKLECKDTRVKKIWEVLEGDIVGGKDEGSFR